MSKTRVADSLGNHGSDFSHGKLSTVAGSAFSNVADLATLDLSHNVLSSIPDSLLTAADSWTALDFSHNDLTAPPSSIANAVVEGYVYAMLIDWLIRWKR